MCVFTVFCFFGGHVSVVANFVAIYFLQRWYLIVQFENNTRQIVLYYCSLAHPIDR